MQMCHSLRFKRFSETVPVAHAHVTESKLIETLKVWLWSLNAQSLLLLQTFTCRSSKLTHEYFTYKHQLWVGVNLGLLSIVNFYLIAFNVQQTVEFSCHHMFFPMLIKINEYIPSNLNNHPVISILFTSRVTLDMCYTKAFKKAFKMSFQKLSIIS